LWFIAAALALVLGLGAAAPAGHALDLGARLASLALIALAAGVALAAWRRSGSREQLAMGLILAGLVAAAGHDFGRLWYVGAWNGLGLDLQPYEGFVLAVACLGSFGRRAAGAFASLRRLNAELEARVIEARRDLAASEAARRELEVADAIKAERERLLREIHDGIGSNLVTALRVAEQQGQPVATIRTLRPALSDLKITVDSLEPVDGDLVALLGNLRHRIEPDLREAGLRSRWKVTDCRPLPWLDAANALHVLRVVQEAVGNVLAHACADEIELGCFEDCRDGEPGLTTYVADNGVGLGSERPAAGRGMANMQARARALHGQLDCAPCEGGGVRVTVWLPFTRDEALAVRT